MASESTVKSVRRVFQVLELFERRRVPASATEVGRALGFPSSSVAALMKSMTALGYLSFDVESKNYFPSPRLLIIGRWIDGALFGRAELLELMADLKAETGETVVLSVRRDVEMQFLHILMADQPIALKVNVGQATPIARSAVGHAELSAMSDEQIEHLVQRINRRAASRVERVRLEELMEIVRRTRRRGYAAGYGLVSPDTGAIALPVRSSAVGSQYVISVGGPTQRIRDREETIVRIMRRAVRAHLSS